MAQGDERRGVWLHRRGLHRPPGVEMFEGDYLRSSTTWRRPVARTNERGELVVSAPTARDPRRIQPASEDEEPARRAAGSFGRTGGTPQRPTLIGEYRARIGGAAARLAAGNRAAAVEIARCQRRSGRASATKAGTTPRGRAGSADGAVAGSLRCRRTVARPHCLDNAADESDRHAGTPSTWPRCGRLPRVRFSVLDQGQALRPARWPPAHPGAGPLARGAAHR